MKVFRYIVALVICTAFAGRAAAQWALFDLDAALDVESSVDNADSGFDNDSDDNCCCDDEDSQADCCGDACDSFACPMMMEPLSPLDDVDAGPVPEFTEPLLFEISKPLPDDWKNGLERPPRFT